jgi:hypothetical protein
MRFNRWSISPVACGFSIALVIVFATASTTSGQTPTTVKQGTVEHIKVHGKSLEGNLEKDSPDRDVFIYLPPDYATNTTKRYPVVYLLHGYGLTAERWMPFTKMAEASDKNIAAGTMKGMILVNPDAYTIYNGSMYSSSVTIGDWESFIATTWFLCRQPLPHDRESRQPRPGRSFDGWLWDNSHRHETS